MIRLVIVTNLLSKLASTWSFQSIGKYFLNQAKTFFPKTR